MGWFLFGIAFTGGFLRLFVPLIGCIAVAAVGGFLYLARDTSQGPHTTDWKGAIGFLVMAVGIAAVGFHFLGNGPSGSCPYEYSRGGPFESC